MSNDRQIDFEDLMNSKNVHPCEGCKYYMNGKCVYPFSRTDYCILGSKKQLNN